MISGRILSFAATLMFLGAPQVSFAQSPVPLTPELFDHSWVVVEYEGREELPETGPTTFLAMDRELGDEVGGNTACGTDWHAKLKLNLPSLKFTDVDGFVSDECPAYRNSLALMKALEKVTSAATTAEGLELRGADKRRLLLLVAGG